MTIYRKVKSLSVADAAYIAGIIDGEGTITLIKKHSRESRQLAVSVSNTERKILEYIHDVIGAGKITNKRVYQLHHKPSYTYQIYNRQALELLEQISPYLHSYKAYRAALILKYYLRLTPRNGKYSLELKQQRELFVEQFFQILSS